MAKLKATEKSKKILKKFFTIILILYIFLFAFMFAFRKYFIEGKNIYTKVSTSHVLQSIPIKDALIIRELTIEKLKNYIKNQEYEKAYDLYSKEYKEFISLENYINEIKKIDIDSVEMAEIKARNDDCYEADIVFDYIDSASELYKETSIGMSAINAEIEKIRQRYNLTDSGEKLEKSENKKEKNHIKYLLYPNEINQEIIKISPDNFIYYFKDINKKAKDLSLKLNSCTVWNNKIELDCDVTNKSFLEDIYISSVVVAYDSSWHIDKDYFVGIEKGSTKNIKITFENTDYLIPNNIKLIQSIDGGEKERIYSFFFEK